MKNKKIYTLLSLAAVGGMLVSCSSKEQSLSYLNRSLLRADIKEEFINTGSQVYLRENGEIIKINDPDDPTVNVLDELRISAPVLSIYYDDSKSNPYQDEAHLSVTGYPKKAPMGTITWSSSDESIAIVDQTGKVTAKGEGIAVITATSTVGKSVSSSVYVNKTNVAPSKITKGAQSIIAAQSDSSFKAPRTIRVDELYTQTKTRGDEIVSSTKFLQKMWASMDDAYFRIVSDDENIKTSGGSIVPGNTGYVFYTTKDYTSYVFSTSNGKANYMSLDQSYLVDQGKAPFAALSEVLQSFFVSGAKIMTSQFKDVLGADKLNGGYSPNERVGTFGENSGQFAFRQISGDSGRAGQEEASDLEIPIGTFITIQDDISYLFANNLLKSKNITETISYKIAGVPYVETINIVYTYETENVDIWWPELSSFLKVDTIFDL